jgi:mono/diheme cytochrome c family protein
VLRTLRNFIWPTVVLFLLVHDTNAEESLLLFRADGKSVAEFRLAELQEIPGQQDFHLHDAMYEKRKYFAGIPLLLLLQEAYGELLSQESWSSVAFVAEEGYEAVAPLNVVRQSGAMLVYRDLEFAGWETFEGKGINPGPYYLVWTEPQQVPKNGYPWPWQIKSINLLDFASTYPAVVPANVARNTAADRGYRIFRSRCISCHSMNRQGGNVGPDLNAPKNIIEYRSETFLKEFIRSPSRFRYSRMPEFSDLSDRDLDDLVRYFQSMPVRDSKPNSASERGDP